MEHRWLDQFENLDPTDLGERIIRLARLAADVHRYETHEAGGVQACPPPTVDQSEDEIRRTIRR